jgi:hypothetical protein
MVAVLVVTPEEHDLITVGRLYDPSYTSFPEVSFGDDDVEDSEESEESPSPRPPAQGDRIERRASAHHFRRYAEHIVLVFSQGGWELPSGQRILELTAVANAEGGPRIGNLGLRWLTVEPWRHIERLALSEILAGMSSARAADLIRVLSGPARPLPPVTAAETVDAIRQLRPSFYDLVTELEEQRPERTLRRRPGARRLMRRDCAVTALRLFDRNWRRLNPLPEPSPAEFDLSLDDVVRTSENDYSPDDAAVFPGWERPARSRLGWWEFRSRGRRLPIKNLNVSSAETATGADLVYARRNPDAFVLVQYKLLRPDSRGEPFYKPDGRLGSQVQKLIRLESAPAGA